MKPFPCGHPRTAENTYRKYYADRGAFYPVCYRCVLERNARWKERNREWCKRSCLLEKVWKGAQA